MFSHRVRVHEGRGPTLTDEALQLDQRPDEGLVINIWRLYQLYPQ